MQNEHCIHEDTSKRNTAPHGKSLLAFTLVELIVVITILAILGTIGFLSVGGYSSQSRDSARIADLAQIAKSLDLGMVTSGNYPMPDNAFSVTYSGAALWYQGTVGSSVLQQLHTSIAGGGLAKKPVDPLKQKDYAYSVLAYGKGYQLKAEYEGDVPAISFGFPDAWAAPGNPTVAYVRGNFNAIAARTQTGNVNYILAVPSILTGTGSAGQSIEVLPSSLSGTLQFNGKVFFGASAFNPVTVVFSSATLPNTDTQVLFMVSSLKTAYSGSDTVSLPAISGLLGTQAGWNLALGNAILQQLGGSAVSSTVVVPPTPSCNGSLPANATSNGTSSSGATWTHSTTSGTCTFICQAGYYYSSPSCPICPANSYCPAGSTSATACPGGTTSPAGSTSAAACITPPRGEQAYTMAGTYNWTVPNSITSVAIVCVGAGGAGSPSDASNTGGGGGGGGLSYSNGVSVTSGESLTVVVGAGGTTNPSSGNPGGTSSVSRGATILVRAAGGGGGGQASASTVAGGLGGQSSAGIGDGKQNGGNGGSSVVSGSKYSGCGGGAAGYTGAGGAGWEYVGSITGQGFAGAGGGGAGGGRATNQAGGGGGGVGLLGAGTSGSPTANAGGGWSSGAAGVDATVTDGGAGGAYGGGGGGADDNNPGPGGVGAGGACRILWGAGRSFPSTDVGTP